MSQFTAGQMVGVVYQHPATYFRWAFQQDVDTLTASLGGLSVSSTEDAYMGNSPWSMSPDDGKSRKRDSSGELVYAPFASEVKRVFGVWERVPLVDRLMFPADGGKPAKAARHRRKASPTSTILGAMEARVGPSAAPVLKPLPRAVPRYGLRLGAFPFTFSCSRDGSSVQYTSARTFESGLLPPLNFPRLRGEAQADDATAARAAAGTGLGSVSMAQSSAIAAPSASSPAPPPAAPKDKTVSTTADNDKTSPAAAPAPASSAVSLPAVSAQPVVQASSDAVMDVAAPGPGPACTSQAAGPVAVVPAVPAPSAGSWSAAAEQVTSVTTVVPAVPAPSAGSSSAAADQVTGATTDSNAAPARPPASGATAEMFAPKGSPSEGMDVEVAAPSTEQAVAGNGSAPSAATPTEGPSGSRPSSTARPSQARPLSKKAKNALDLDDPKANKIHKILVLFDEDSVDSVTAESLHSHVQAVFDQIKKLMPRKLAEKLRESKEMLNAVKYAGRVDVDQVNWWLADLKDEATSRTAFASL
ncbi:hypothetical protein SLS58_009183 [Diplodia intermedia]|uniref:Uncharacterized protein n=1 Tax=Diplodia intermedia TaxID=856260 RepID=A0ABR3TE15_9PEZI